MRINTADVKAGDILLMGDPVDGWGNVKVLEVLPPETLPVGWVIARVRDVVRYGTNNRPVSKVPYYTMNLGARADGTVYKEN